MIVTLAAGAALSLAAADEPVAVDGQVFDTEGRALAGVTVVLVDRASGLASLARGAQEIELGRTRTDRQGFFRIEADRAQAVGRLLVRCLVEERWDRQRYEPPDDVDVSGALREQGHAIATVLVREAPAWRELRRAILRAGGTATERGRILRTHGMPPETVATADGRVTWIYPSASYVFDPAGRLVESRRGSREIAGTAARDAS